MKKMTKFIAATAGTVLVVGGVAACASDAPRVVDGKTGRRR